MNYKRLFVSNSIIFITFVTSKRREISGNIFSKNINRLQFIRKPDTKR